MRTPRAIGGLAALILVLGAMLSSGCLGEPKLEERWTRLDLDGANTTPFQSVSVGVRESVSVQARLTYRRIITGFAVADLRASSTLLPTDVEVHPDAPRLRMAQDIDRILLNSVSVGRATRAITGWDHLIQHVDLAFGTTVPTVVDTATGGGATSLFLLVYLGAGDKVERQDGSDTLIITPFNSSEYELLPVGMEFAITPPPVPSAARARGNR